MLFEEVFVTCLKGDADYYLKGDPLANPRIKLNKPKKKIVGVHVIFLVHGFQARAAHMKLIKNNIQFLFPDTMVYCSEANEDDTTIDIREMGKKLAEEVEDFIINWCYNSLTRLSFVGHSMGGVIIRAALPHLAKYKRKMFSFMTLSSPHLGFMYGSGFLFK